MGSITSISHNIHPYLNASQEVEVLNVDSAHEVLGILSDVSPEDLVVFDVDEVLITLQDTFLRPVAADVCNPTLFGIFRPLSDPKNTELFGEWISQVKVELVSEELVEGISQLQCRGCQVIALTSMIPGAGACGKIPSMEDFRFNELYERGIDFRVNFNLKDIELDFPMKNGRTPCLKDGILYARPYTKGEVLQRLLDRSGITPKRVWFIDNDPKHVTSVSEAMQKSRIPFTGIQYLDNKFSEEQYDLKLGEFQFEHFKATKIWLNDEQAKIAMKR